MSTPSSADGEVASALASIWLLLSGMLILLFEAGMLSYAAGYSLAKNVKSTLLRQVLDATIGSVAFVIIGWGLFRGSNPFASGSDAHFYTDDGSQALVFQQFGYCVVSSSLISASLQGRCKLWITTLVSILVCAVFWPIGAHWAWDSHGYLNTLGFKDFAGSGVVHLFAGTCALIANWACGPRVNRFGKGTKYTTRLPPYLAWLAFKLGGGPRVMRTMQLLSGNPDPELVVRAVQGHSVPLIALGAMVCAVAWIPLNAGNGMTTDITSGGLLSSRAAINSLVSGNASVVSALLWSILARHSNDLSLVTKALFAGLVAVAGPCATISLWAAIVVGILAFFVMLATETIVTYAFKIDDPLGIVGVHGACGLLGLLWEGLADEQSGLFYSGDAHLIGVQMLGGLCLAACGVAASSPFLLARIFMGSAVAYPEDEQLMGLDFIYFQGTAYPDLDLEFSMANAVNGKSRRGSAHFNKNDSDLAETSVHSEGKGFGVYRQNMSRHQSESSVTSPSPMGSSTQVLPPKPATNFSSDALDVILNDESLRKRLKQFLSANHMDENVRFMDSVVARAADPVESFRVSSARAICLMFVEEKAPKAINLAAPIRQELLRAYQKGDVAELGRRDLFDKALKELYHDLRQNPAFKQFVVQVFGGVGSGGML